jgi:TetR/AcrR family transcriptional regulator, acrAB operon repressor
MVRKTKEEALETRNQLLDAAEDVFCRDGYARTTLDGVAEAAGMTRGAIYWHFKNKSDLFNAMCDRVVLPMEELSQAGIDDSPEDPLGHVRTVCIFFLTECVHNSHLRKVVDILFRKTEFVDKSDPMFIRQQEGFLRGRERIIKSFSLAVECGILPVEIDVRLATIFFQASIEGILQHWLISPESFSLADDAERLVDACLDAVRHATSLRKVS